MSTSVIRSEASNEGVILSRATDAGVILSEATEGSGVEGSFPESPICSRLLAAAVLRLEAAGVPDAKWDAGELLAWAGGPDRTHLPLVRDAVLSEAVVSRFEEVIRIRERRVPLQQITGTAWFMGLPFRVSEDVLCPRSDTEVLAELALKRIGERKLSSPKILDLCCGSGCIGISLARFLPGAEVWLSDLSA
ncbi:MAG: methyltransferase, partial [Lachnospiraceae bacterium]|nr:methyltransferase [Lachnospiraceae bacterium]